MEIFGYPIIFACRLSLSIAHINVVKDVHRIDASKLEAKGCLKRGLKVFFYGDTLIG